VVAEVVGGLRQRTASMISLGSKSLRVCRGGSEVGMLDLALDDVDRNRLAGEFDCMGSQPALT
jgi:hypothetical protein